MFLVLRETPDGDPVVATADPRVVAAVLRAVQDIATGPAPLRLVEDGAPPPGPRKSVTKALRATICQRPGCGQPLPTERGRGSVRKWCSDRCKNLAWQAAKAGAAEGGAP